MTLTAGQNTVTFKSFGVDLVGDLYLPEGFDQPHLIGPVAMLVHDRLFGQGDDGFGSRWSVSEG